MNPIMNLKQFTDCCIMICVLSLYFNNSQIHVYLVYIVLGNFACTAIEMKHRNSVLAAMARILLTMVHGFWFITIGWMLYPPSGSPVFGRSLNEHDKMTMVSQPAWKIVTWCMDKHRICFQLPFLSLPFFFLSHLAKRSALYFFTNSFFIVHLDNCFSFSMYIVLRTFIVKLVGMIFPNLHT